MKAFFSLLAILWNSAFKWVYLSFSPLLFASLLFTAISKASSDSHFAFLHFFFLGMVLIPVSCTMSQTYVLGPMSPVLEGGFFTTSATLHGAWPKPPADLLVRLPSRVSLLACLFLAKTFRTTPTSVSLVKPMFFSLVPSVTNQDS